MNAAAEAMNATAKASLELTLFRMEHDFIAAHPSLVGVLTNTSELAAMVAVLNSIVTLRSLLETSNYPSSTKENPMKSGLEQVAAHINAEEAYQAQLLRKAIGPLVQAHYAVFEAAHALLDQLAPRPSTSDPAPVPAVSPDLPCPSSNPAAYVGQSIPQRKDTYAVQNPVNFGNSIFGRTEAIYQELAAAAKNIAKQDVAAAHEGRGVMLFRRRGTFVLLSVIGQADLPNREFAELDLALEAAAMFLSGLVSAASGS